MSNSLHGNVAYALNVLELIFLLVQESHSKYSFVDVADKYQPN